MKSEMKSAAKAYHDRGYCTHEQSVDPEFWAAVEVEGVSRMEKRDGLETHESWKKRMATIRERERLAASAPEMLAALQDIIKHSNQDPDWNKLRAIIAKATGGEG